MPFQANFQFTKEQKLVDSVAGARKVAKVSTVSATKTEHLVHLFVDVNPV